MLLKQSMVSVAIPEKTDGHSRFAIAMTTYIVIAVKFFEEPNLVAAHGHGCKDFQGKAPMICPWPKGRA